ncbi:MAG TPA: hypothetical protein VMZ52_03505 [Bryobacteraceae bacterium]|nr:hypothetical protein [Bryobacteraceae bacterium]
MTHESVVTVTSTYDDRVRFKVVRMSFGRRLDLARRVRTLSQRQEFQQAGTEFKDKVEAVVLAAEIDRLYLEWGLVEVIGLLLDGAPATPAGLISWGPEELCREALAAIKSQCGLSEAERKN